MKSVPNKKNLLSQKCKFIPVLKCYNMNMYGEVETYLYTLSTLTLDEG
jgi:hypothetical protein